MRHPNRSLKTTLAEYKKKTDSKKVIKLTLDWCRFNLCRV